MKVAAWNVNSVRARLPHVLAYLNTESPDALLLQETKSTDDKFPAAEFAEIGYHSAYYGQPSYNGVAIISREVAADVVCGMPNRPADGQARLIAGTVAGMRLLSVYVPNGQSLESDKYQYKLSWLADFADYLAGMAGESVLAGGDYNIAPADADIYDAADWGEGILASAAERAALQKLFAAGYHDAHRLFEQPEKLFSWWDYRQAAFRRNRGIRIDLMLLSASLSRRCRTCVPDVTPRQWERPSDHTPVVAEFE